MTESIPPTVPDGAVHELLRYVDTSAHQEVRLLLRYTKSGTLDWLVLPGVATGTPEDWHYAVLRGDAIEVPVRVPDSDAVDEAIDADDHEYTRDERSDLAVQMMLDRVAQVIEPMVVAELSHASVLAEIYE